MIIGALCLAAHVGLLHLAWSPVLDQASGLLVGASLVAIGLLGYREGRAFEEQHLWSQPQAAPRRRGKFGWATYATGVLHGLSPDALLFIAPALALPRFAGVFHVAGVVLGTLMSMGALTALLGALCQRSARLKLISSSASSVAMLLGACIMVASMGVSFPLPGL